MKRILLLTDGWKRFVTYAWTIGANRYISENEKDFVLYQLQSWGSWSKNRDFNRGEYSIYDLSNFQKFDGAIVDFTNFSNEDRLNEIIERLKASNIPVVSVGFEAHGFHYVGINGYKATKEIFNHLYDVHHCRKFFFVGGPEDHFDNIQREEGFLDSLKEHDMEFDHSMLSNGDFTEQTGIACADSFYTDDEGHELNKAKRALPDVFICSNDNIAVGLISELNHHGVSVPEDVLVTGFDDLDKAMYYKPQITTAVLNREGIGYEACRILDELMQGKEISHGTFVDAEVIFTESCGCPNSGRVDYREYLKWQIDDNIFSINLSDKLAEIRADLENTTSIYEFMNEIADTYSEKDLDGVYIVLNNDLITTNAETYLPCGGFSYSDMTVVAAREYGRVVSSYSPNELYKKIMNEAKRGTNYFAMALHMKEETAGFVILMNPRFIMKDWRVYETEATFLQALSDWYDGTKLKKSVHELTKIYDKDPLTKLYSRSAFSIKILPIYSSWLKERRQVAALFLDADGFKQVNDNYGHDYGDKVLIQIAKVIKENLPNEGFGIRYGGDEFLILFPVSKKREVDSLVNTLYSRLNIDKISMSIGYATLRDEFSENEGIIRESLDRLITKADKVMYKVKEEHHSLR